MYEEVNKIIDPLYMVGGCIRDELLGRRPKDYDFTTPLTPDEVENRVKASGRRAYLIGKKFGTVGFKVKQEAGEHEGYEYVEVTTFRAEQYTPGSRKPEVEFVTSIEQDLSRRDFTINAIAKRGGRFIDPHGGRLDILERKIKGVGNVTERFKEDPLRILRAARFAAQLDFEIDPNMIGKARKLAHTVYQVSKERWVEEMDKLLTAPYPEKGLKALADMHVLRFILPELWLQVGYDQDSPYHALTLWEHTMETVRQSPNDVDLRWAALLHDVGKPAARVANSRGYHNYILHDLIGAELVLGIALRLKWSNARREKVFETVKHHLRDESPIRAADNASKSRLP